jgi:hypothetical protein
MKDAEAAKTHKAVYAPPTLQKQQLIEEVLGTILTTHGVPA